MPKQGQRADINAFVKGLITEASELNFPADAFSDAENFELNRKGTINRRLGMDYEDDFIEYDSALMIENVDTVSTNTFRWLSAGGDTTLDILVVQFGQRLFLFDTANEPLSAGYIGVVLLSSFDETIRFSFASLEGRLAVVAGADTVAVISYPSLNVEYGRILTRDVWGLEEIIEPRYETDPSFRGAITGEHYYNLSNQSWGIPRRDSSNNLVDPSNFYFTAYGKEPSNSEQVWPGLQFQAVATGQAPFERIFVNLYEEVLGANTQTAKGYFIIDALRRGQSRQDQFLANKAKYPTLSGDVVFKSDLTSGGAKCIVDFAGRVFYAGFDGTLTDGDKRSPEYSNYVFFSQVVKSSQDFFKCYQDGDPTSRENSDLVDTDGGFIRISGAKDIIALRNLETSLIVFATNGIWSVTGGNDYGFSATNYKATKISSFGALSESSVIVEGGSAFYWAEDGIYTIGRNNLGDQGVTNMSLPTIQSFYENISNVSKLKAVGTYDLFTKKIRWVYKEGDLFTSNSVTKELVFDSALGAFSVNRIMNRNETDIEVAGLFRSSAFKIDITANDIFANTNLVLVGTDSVEVDSLQLESALQSTKYLVLRKTVDDGVATFSFSFGEYNNISWADWQSVDSIGVDAFAYGYAGVQTAGDSAVRKQIPYLVFHMYRTEIGTDAEGTPLRPSGCRVRYQWDFSDAPISKKFTTLFQVYRYVKPFFPTGLDNLYDNGFSILTTKNKVRGEGRAFQMYFQTEPGKDCQIVGWSLTVNGNSIT